MSKIDLNRKGLGKLTESITSNARPLDKDEVRQILSKSKAPSSPKIGSKTTTVASRGQSQQKASRLMDNHKSFMQNLPIYERGIKRDNIVQIDRLLKDQLVVTARNHIHKTNPDTSQMTEAKRSVTTQDGAAT